jgi:hypothetical protein
MQHIRSAMNPTIRGLNAAFGHDDPITPAEERVIAEVRADLPRPSPEDIRELARRLNRKPPR